MPKMLGRLSAPISFAERNAMGLQNIGTIQFAWTMLWDVLSSINAALLFSAIGYCYDPDAQFSSEEGHHRHGS